MKTKRQIKRVSLGAQLHSMYLQLLVRDESAAVHFIDSLPPLKKMTLSNYWRRNGQDELRQAFFKSAS